MNGFLKRILIYSIVAIAGIFIVGFGARWADNHRENYQENLEDQAKNESDFDKPQQTIDLFARGLELGYAAAVAAQSAKTRDDWEAVSRAWNNAINILSRVGQDSSNYGQAQAKMQEYEANKKVAEERAQSLPAIEKPSTNNATAQLIDKDPGEWYEGGNLHNATALEWQRSTNSNKLATCTDFVAAAFQEDLLVTELNNTIETVEDFRPLAEGCVDGVDAALEEISDPEVNERTYANQKVSEIASLVMITAGWIDN